MIPPIFVPYRSAITVIIMTIKAASMKGITDCMRNGFIERGIKFSYKIYAGLFSLNFYICDNGADT